VSSTVRLRCAFVRSFSCFKTRERRIVIVWLRRSSSLHSRDASVDRKGDRSARDFGWAYELKDPQIEQIWEALLAIGGSQ
jgi:hypothetical protein